MDVDRDLPFFLARPAMTAVEGRRRGKERRGWWQWAVGGGEGLQKSWRCDKLADMGPAGGI